MALEFWARGDNSSANNASLNVVNTRTIPTTELIFESTTGGDVILEPNGGGVYPDTTVTINGVTQTFTVEFTGLLPNTNKLDDVEDMDLRGEEVMVITAEDGTRYFFLTEVQLDFDTMDDFPNGAHAIESMVTCFVQGTLIRTTKGEVPVEFLEPGDMIITADGAAKPLRWIGSRKLTSAEVRAFPQYRPIYITKDAFGPGLPDRDLWVSQNHRVMLSGWRTELLFAEKEMLVAAKFLVNDHSVRVQTPQDGVTYYHLMFDQHEIIYSEGLETESFHPGRRGLIGIGKSGREEVFALFPELRYCLDVYGGLARPMMLGHEARLLNALKPVFN